MRRGISLPTPTVLFHPISQELKELPGFHNLQTYYPGLSLVCKLREVPHEDLWLDHKERVVHAEATKTTAASGPCLLTLEANGIQGEKTRRQVAGFRKITHLLDPVRWLQGKYSLPRNHPLPWHAETWGPAWKKLQDPMNQAYVEALACYGLGKLREDGYSPHFHIFYGAFCAQADTYVYNITDSYMSYRHCRWFWTSQEKEMFKLTTDNEVPEEVREALFQKPEEIDSSDDETGSEDSEERKSVESLGSDSLDQASGELQSLTSAGDNDFEQATETTASGTDNDSDSSDDLNIFAEIRNFPVMMIYTEASEGTMDDLLDDYEKVGAKPGSAEWEQIWSAWIFQVIAALCAAQGVLGFVHNDLHSNNIVWVNTDQKYLYYSSRDGIVWAVPTYGRIFRIIDFGRAIFNVNQTIFFSDDFREGNDAAEQYNFGELYDPRNGEVVAPNPSFDLSRFAVSIFESLYPQSPPVKEKGNILSQEPGLTIRETTSHLYNLLWTWLLCDDGHNVLMNADGRERYPDFDLYKVISAKVHRAAPCEQVRKPLFEMFRVKRESVPSDATIYSLFC